LFSIWKAAVLETLGTWLSLLLKELIEGFIATRRSSRENRERIGNFGIRMVSLGVFGLGVFGLVVFALVVFRFGIVFRGVPMLGGAGPAKVAERPLAADSEVGESVMLSVFLGLGFC
jgi:hypothetical protein